MPTLNTYFVLYTDGTSPHPAVHRDFSLIALPAIPVPDAGEEFFGPFAQVAHEQIHRARAAFLLRGHRQVRGSVGEFFSQAHAELAQCVEGRSGFAVDLLKMWALPFADISELPSDPLAEGSSSRSPSRSWSAVTSPPARTAWRSSTSQR